MILFFEEKTLCTHIINPRKFNWRNLPMSTSCVPVRVSWDMDRDTWTWRWTWADGHGQGQGHMDVDMGRSRCYKH